MANAKRDQNSVTVTLGTSNADGATPLNVTVDPTTHIIQTLDGTTGSDLSSANARRDSNSVPVLLGVSSTDGVTPVAIYIDSSTGKLLTKST